MYYKTEIIHVIFYRLGYLGYPYGAFLLSTPTLCWSRSKT